MSCVQQQSTVHILCLCVSNCHCNIFSAVLLLLMLLWYLVFDAARVNYCIKQNCFLSVLVQCFKHKQKVFPLIIVCRYSSDSIGMDLVLLSKWNVAFTIIILLFGYVLSYGIFLHTEWNHLSVAEFVCFGIFLALLDTQDCVFHLTFIASLVFRTLSLCQVGQPWLDGWCQCSFCALYFHLIGLYTMFQ